jgi:mannose-6-phosphate isomerase-like protein (cupin superfamily)
MKKYFTFCLLLIVFMVLNKNDLSYAQSQTEGYILEHEKDIAVEEPGTHNGGGMTTGYTFFKNAKDLKLVFKKRVLRPGSAIGYHLQKNDEIYYILSGTGEMQMNGKIFTVTAGDNILTRSGSSHGLKPAGKDSLTLIINYEQ